MSSDVYFQRRKSVMEKMDGGIAVIPSASIMIKNSDVDYRFRQNSNFFYLTGFDEPNAILVLSPNHKEHKTILFLQPKDPEKEIWTGIRLGVGGAISQLGMDKSYPNNDFANEIGQYLEGQKRVYIDLYSQPNLLQTVLQQTQTVIRKKRGNIGPTQFFHVDEILGPMRLVKTEDDLFFIRKAIEITNTSHRAAMAFSAPGKKEYEVQALIEFLFRKHGANGEAYGSIVAGGANANILHYVNNNDTLRDGDLLLIDAGCEYGYYASDVTRSFPINGKFSHEQKIIYDLVLQSQLKCIEISKPGVTLEQLHQEAVRVLVSGLIDLKFFSGSVEEVIANESYKKFYPHRTGHWLGLDVHDLGPYRTSDGNDFVKTIPGMIYTIEPGLYIPADAQEVPPAFRGIGIRTEDDILITENGHENLTKAIPKTISEIENACKEDYREFLLE